MSSERESILQKSPETPVAANNKAALYHDSSQSPGSRTAQICFVSLVVVMVLITVSLSIYKGVSSASGGFMYFMLGVNLLALSVLEIIMIIFIRKGDLPKGKTWFLYFVGGAVILEAIFTDVAISPV